MKPSQSEMQEGPNAFDRFRKAMTTIVHAPKSRVTDTPAKPVKRKKSAKP